MSDRNYDIIVAGAGPAGAMAAISAAAAGKRVCLVERKSAVGVPVRCGEAVGFRGLTQSAEPRAEWIRSELSRARMVSPSGIEVNVGSGAEGWILDRERMDADLVRAAVDKGAELLVSAPVTRAERLGDGRYRCFTSNKRVSELTAGCLILADGVESRLARCFGWDTALRLGDIESCAFARVKADGIEPDCCVFYTGSAVAPGGYAWVFPRGGGEANVGLGVNGAKCEAGMPARLLTAFVGRRFPGARVTDLHCGGVPVGRWVRPLVRGAVMLAGDAARQVNAVNGAGIAYSLYAGRIAGAVAARAVRADGTADHRVLAEYQREWAKNFGRQQDRSFALKEFITSADDRFLDRIASVLSKEDPGRISYLSVFTRTFASRPLLLIKAFNLFR